MRSLQTCAAAVAFVRFLQCDIGAANGFVVGTKPGQTSTWGKAATVGSNKLPPHQATSSSNQEKRPWEFLRFVQQSSKFVTLPNLNPFGGGKASTAVKPGDVVWQPSSKSITTLPFTFAPLDDVVMGGASNSNFDTTTGTWRGTVTDANNGGFIGIRSTPPSLQLDLSQCQGLEWKIQFRSKSGSRGGKRLRFKVIVRDSTEFNGICWTTSVDLDPSPKALNTLRIPFRKQVPTIFARTVPGQTFQPGNVMAVQLTYSKFEYDGDLNPKFELGDIELQILEIRAY